MRHRIFPSLLSLSLALGLCVLPAAALETDDLKTLLQTYYVDQVPENVLDQDTVQAVLDALNDPYTTYMTAEEYQSFLNQVDGETVVGIGVSIQTTVNDGVQILSVLEGSPAQEAGLSAGDRILSVDGRRPATATCRWTASPWSRAWTPPPSSGARPAAGPPSLSGSTAPARPGTSPWSAGPWSSPSSPTS